MATLNGPWRRTSYNSSPINSTGPMESLTDVRTPLVKTPRGPWRLPTNYTRTITNTAHPQGRVKSWPLNHPTWWDQETGCIQAQAGTQCGDVPIPSFSNLKKRAEIGALLNLKDSTINLAQSFGERVATADTVNASVLRLVRAARRLRHGDPRGAARELMVEYRKSPVKGFAQDWLALKYGWVPILSDVHGACQALARADRSDPRRYTVTVKKTVSSSSQVRVNKLGPISYEGTTWGGTTQHRYTYSSIVKEGAFVRLDYNLINDILQDVNEVGILDPQVLAWELLPYSFVCDWFVPVGDYLSALTADRGYEFKSGSCTQRIEQMDRYRSLPSPGTDDDWYGGRRYFKIQRSTYSASPVPHLYMKNPFKGLLGGNSDDRGNAANRLLTSIALLTSVFRK